MARDKRKIYLEDLTIGEKLQSSSYVVPRQESIEFARHWDPQPFHIDEEAARQVYGNLTACSAYIFATFCKLGNSLYEDGVVQAVAGLGFDEMRMHKPMFVDDTVYVVSEFTDIRRSNSKPDRGIVRAINRMYNQNDELIFSVYSTAMILARGLPSTT